MPMGIPKEFLFKVSNGREVLIVRGKRHPWGVTIDITYIRGSFTRSTRLELDNDLDECCESRYVRRVIRILKKRLLAPDTLLGLISVALRNVVYISDKS
jgi:hypothetical protein